MDGILRLILDSLEYLWPFRIVRQWARGGYYIFGRYWRSVGPGLYPVVPFFTNVLEISVVPAILGTPRIDITLQDGSTLSFTAAATVEVVDFALAINTVDKYAQTTQELLGAILAQRLADVDRGRLAPDKRGRLLADLLRWLNEESLVFGVSITKVRFTTFLLNVKNFRLLQETHAELW
jgi:regulator of protease activity HflC (stomatin/prohibitin superfamily)